MCCHNHPDNGSDLALQTETQATYTDALGQINDLLEALERIEKRCDIDPTNLPVKMFTGEIKSMARAAIAAAKETG